MGRQGAPPPARPAFPPGPHLSTLVHTGRTSPTRPARRFPLVQTRAPPVCTLPRCVSHLSPPPFWQALHLEYDILDHDNDGPLDLEESALGLGAAASDGSSQRSSIEPEHAAEHEAASAGDMLLPVRMTTSKRSAAVRWPVSEGAAATKRPSEKAPRPRSAERRRLAH